MSVLSPKFFIGSIKIGSIEGASCFNMGNNYPNNFTSHVKQNQGFGKITGDQNDIRGILSKLDDRDQMDMINENDLGEVPEWIKDLVSTMNANNEKEENEIG